MGVVHLLEIEIFLKKNKNESFTETFLSKNLNINYDTVKESMRYFKGRNWIEKDPAKKNHWRWKK